MQNCIQLSLAWLIWPITLATFTVSSFRALKKHKFVQSLPLLLTQLNSLAIWLCLAIGETGFFNWKVTGVRLLYGDPTGYRKYLITSFLWNLIFFEPLNLFLYSWAFLKEIEESENDEKTKKYYKWFRISSIIVIPLAFVSLTPVMIVEMSKWKYYHYNDLVPEA